MIMILISMPISPDKKHLYADNWKKIRARILKRAENRCEFCGVKNYAVGFRDADGKFWEETGDSFIPKSVFEQEPSPKLIRIVLTIAHLDNDPTNNDEDNNLRALCQQCHLRHDAKFHQANRSHTRATKSESQGQERMI